MMRAFELSRKSGQSARIAVLIALTGLAGPATSRAQQAAPSNPAVQPNLGQPGSGQPYKQVTPVEVPCAEHKPPNCPDGCVVDEASNRCKLAPAPTDKQPRK